VAKNKGEVLPRLFWGGLKNVERWGSCVRGATCPRKDLKRDISKKWGQGIKPFQRQA